MAHTVVTESPTHRGVTRFQEDIVTSRPARMALAALRLVVGFYFVWAFVDKLFGLNYMTPSARAWINGGTPAQGFLKGASKEGPFAGLMSFFASWGTFADVLFMLGLLGIGVALMTGAGLKIAAITGTLLMFFMYLAEFPQSGAATNPIVDSHWVEALAMIVAATTLAGDTWGIGKWWGTKVGDGWLR